MSQLIDGPLDGTQTRETTRLRIAGYIPGTEWITIYELGLDHRYHYFATVHENALLNMPAAVDLDAGSEMLAHV